MSKTIEEILAIFTGTQAEDWHKHANGGGWVYKNATVDATAYIGPDARVTGSAWVTGNARVTGSAWVTGSARVAGSAQVSGNALVAGSAWVKSPLYIQGSRHELTHTKAGWLKIGCQIMSIEDWQKKYKAIGRAEKYSKDEIAEYGAYIELFAARDKAVFGEMDDPRRLDVNPETREEGEK